jgi:hypothetical protein
MPSFQVIYLVGYEIIDGIKRMLVKMRRKKKNTSTFTKYIPICTTKIFSVFPNVEIAMRIFLSMVVANASGERSFSKLKFIKNELRYRMTQPRLNNSSLMCITNYISEKY